MADYTHIRGDDFSLEFTVTDPNNGDAVVDLSGWTIRSQIRYKGNLTQEFTVTIATDPTTGIFTLSAPAADAQGWRIADHDWDIEFIQPGVGKSSTTCYVFQVVKDVTNDDP